MIDFVFPDILVTVRYPQFSALKNPRRITKYIFLILLTILLCGSFLHTPHEENFLPPRKLSSYLLESYPQIDGE